MILLADSTVLIDYHTAAVNLLAGDTLAVWLSHLNDDDPTTTTREPGVEVIRAGLAQRGWLVPPPRHLTPDPRPHPVIRLPEPGATR